MAATTNPFARRVSHVGRVTGCSRRPEHEEAIIHELCRIAGVLQEVSNSLPTQRGIGHDPVKLLVQRRFGEFRKVREFARLRIKPSAVDHVSEVRRMVGREQNQFAKPRIMIRF